MPRIGHICVFSARRTCLAQVLASGALSPVVVDVYVCPCCGREQWPYRLPRPVSTATATAAITV